MKPRLVPAVALSLAGLALVLEGSPPALYGEERPNILFAIADDWSHGHAGAYGCDWVETPNFDRLASEGILFHRAFTPNAKCAPSRATILTGRYSWQLEEAGNHICEFPPKYGGFMERLASGGYRTGYTGKGWGPGRALDRDGAPRLITGKSYARRRAEPPASGISRNDYAANFADFLADGDAETPWIFWYGTTEPHRGYELGSGERLGKKLSDIDRVPAYWPDNKTIRRDMLDYAVEVEHFDTHLGRILDILEAEGILDNTLVVATSDHGMPFPRVKGQAYEDSNHVPLAIRWPNGIQGSGREVDDFVSFTDLAPTFLQAAGIDEPRPIMAPMNGHSLFDIFAANGSGQINPLRDFMVVGKERHDIGRPDDLGYPIRGIYQGDWLYIENFEPDRWPACNPETGYLNCDGSPTKTWILEARRDGVNQTYWKLNFGKRAPIELYDLRSDGDCVVNLADEPEQSERVASMRSAMVEILKTQGDPRMFGAGHVFDRYEYVNAGTRNFYNRYISGERPNAGWVNPSDFEPQPIE